MCCDSALLPCGLPALNKNGRWTTLTEQSVSAPRVLDRCQAGGDEQAEKGGGGVDGVWCLYFYQRQSAVMFSNDGAYFGFCIISQVRVWYRKWRRVSLEKKSTGRQRSGAVMINQRQSVLLSDGAAAQPLKAFGDRDDAFNMHDYLWQLQPNLKM